MNRVHQAILDDYRRERPNFLKLETIAVDKLKGLIHDAGIEVEGFGHRVKSFESLEGKIFRYGDAAQTMDDITDLLGIRVICFFNEDVAKVCRLVEDNFSISWEDSVNTRERLNVNAFGYLSVHYIVYFDESSGYPPEVCHKRFEVQVRTLLQHAWAQTEHDLGYKSDFGVPAPVLRSFARLAGLLELADDEFSRLKAHMAEYIEGIRQKIIDNEADDVPLDVVSLRTYMKYNTKVADFLQTLGEATGTEIEAIDPEPFLVQFNWLEKKTVGDLQEMLERNSAEALEMARNSAAIAPLDLLSSNAALRFLCLAELRSGKYTQEQAADFISLTVKNRARAEKQAEKLFCE